MTLISDAIGLSLERSSWIRKMFEEGARLKAEVGADNVCDFSLGNPILEPPPKFYQSLKSLLENPPPGLHRYLPNPGLPEVRAYVARTLTEEFAPEGGPAYEAGQVVMTCGAAGGMNVALKAMLNPGDEVLTLTPYFVEYDFYVDNHGGKLVRVPTTEDFQIDLEALQGAITPRTRALIINSPNNPTGVVYGHDSLRALADLLTKASTRIGRNIVLLSDEPYRRLVYDDTPVPWLPALYDHTLVINSHSKDLGLAGERLGYVAANPRMEDPQKLVEALVLANRILGFVNAPALIQRLLPHLHGESVDVNFYRENRDKLVAPMREMGYEMVMPQGAFFLFPRSPIKDDVAFVQAAQKEHLLLVPGSGFGGPGHFRISYAVPPEVIDRALPLLDKVLKQVRG